jgi:hypothetical protein
MSRTTYEAAWRLLEVIGDNRGPMLLDTAAEFRACLLREREPEESRPPAENPYIQAAISDFGAVAASSALFERSTPI